MDSGDGISVLGISLLVAVVVFLAVIIGTVMGFVTGWIISVTPLAWHVETGFKTLFGINVNGLLPQIGAVLGFIGGFFSSRASAQNNND